MRGKPLPFAHQKGRGRNKPFSFEDGKTFLAGLTHPVAFDFGTHGVFISSDEIVHQNLHGPWLESAILCC
jgi:hypothetical protein